LELLSEQQNVIKLISECYMFRPYRLSSGNKMYGLKHKYVCAEMFRNLRDLTNFNELLSNRRSMKFRDGLHSN